MRYALLVRLLFVFVLLLGCEAAPGSAPDAQREIGPRDMALPVDGPRVEADGPVAPIDDFGQPCTGPEDCRSGFCVVVRGNERECTRRCGSDADCPSDWLCRQIVNAGADVTFACVPREAPCAGADLQRDPAHCGECQNACAFAGASALCEAGVCAMGPCDLGFADLDGEASNGCEYACLETRDGVEACDEIDNDCDGSVDEGFDLERDRLHCGACAAACRPANATGACAEGACGVGVCAEGFEDANGDPSDGCEEGCVPTREGVEVCDGIDNDCDGQSDEDTDLQADPLHCGACDTRCARANAEVACEAGQCVRVACLEGFFDRDGEAENGCEVGCEISREGLEACDEIDNDCDGAVDEGVDVLADPANCGECGRACAHANGLSECREGACRLVGCLQGFFDRDGEAANGCEVGCEISLEGVEACDGVDNDCDGATDEDTDFQSDAEHCGACGRACAEPNALSLCEEGACAFVECVEGFVDLDPVAPGCDYACVAVGEELCNGADEDCDGAIDEAFDFLADAEHCGACGVVCARPNAETSCDEGLCVVDRCAPGFIDLNRRGQDGCELACVFQGPEACNARDDDCDGLVDEGFAVQDDANNCGGCGQVCRLDNATPTCVEGRCRVVDCAEGFVDVDGVARTGCECEVLGAEDCNGRDDDCDGRLDEAFDLQSDPAHCGACGAVCEVADGAPRCVGGECAVEGCDEGFVDRNEDYEDGCECVVRPEACSGQDEDCDGRSDEDFDLQSDVAHCGACNQRCRVDDGRPICAGGRCRVDACDEGFVDRNDEVADGCECQVRPDLCEGSDEDCDGRVDEDYDLQSDAQHCGACGRACRLAQATPRCGAGVCEVDECAEGFVDRDGEAPNGCECQVRPDLCEGSDEDCDGRVDEDYDLQGDPLHCGACGRACQLSQATPRCNAGVCAVEECAEGFVDRDGEAPNGCECRVQPDLCEGSDEDCDGRVDEDFDLQGDPLHCGACGRTCALPNASVLCVAGGCRVDECAEGFVDRNGDAPDGCECRVRAETCDGADNDCDGRTDEDFDLQSDPRNCGVCGRGCALENAGAECIDGQCAVEGCQPGFADRNEDPGDGCECPIEAEVCDGADNDCDRRSDEGFDLQSDVSHCGACLNACALDQASEVCVQGGCRVDQCEGGWADRNTEPEDGCECRIQAEVCDGSDNDCDTRVDEGFDLQSDGAHCGACGNACALDHASEVCVAGACAVGDCEDGWADRNTEPEDGCECRIQAETCDGADNDCDTRIDEGFDLQSDVSHCGACDNDCDLDHASEVCAEGACGVGDCDNGWADRNGEAPDGCECRIQAEVCDGSDNDCDTRVDEGFDLQSDEANCGACNNACALDNAVPVCVDGGCRVDNCAQGFGDANGEDEDGCECVIANGGVESCDGSDEDCDGSVDEGFDLQNDPNHCGACGALCEGDNASYDCQQGDCVIVDCDAGWADDNEDPDDGCEAVVEDFPYDGTYDLDDAVSYSCHDTFFGELAFSMNFSALSFLVAGNELGVTGANTRMDQGPPAPTDGSFSVVGQIDGGDFGCTETYSLVGDFSDDDTWSATFRVSFFGFACDFTDCTDQVRQLTGRRQ